MHAGSDMPTFSSAVYYRNGVGGGSHGLPSIQSHVEADADTNSRLCRLSYSDGFAMSHEGTGVLSGKPRLRTVRMDGSG